MCETTLRRKVYECLEQLEIPYERVDTEEAITMEDCEAIDSKLQMKTVKTLFLCYNQEKETATGVRAKCLEKCEEKSNN